MKQRTKGILAFAFLGGIMVTSGVTIAIPGVIPEDESMQMTVTGTPQDNYPDADRPQFCGSSDPKSTPYVREYAVPTVCTNPLAVTTDYDGNVWFTQTNTGKLAMFDPATEEFAEYDNPSWPRGQRSMMWGIDYAPDGTVWYTDEAHDSVWRFSPGEGTYDRKPYPSEGNSLPQKLQVDGSQIIINDFTGNKLTLLDPTSPDDAPRYVAVPSPINGSVTADFAIDQSRDVWYTNWLFGQGGVLVRFDQDSYLDTVAETGEEFQAPADYQEIFGLPPALLTPNGIEVDAAGGVWLADTTSSYFFRFDPATASYDQYVTADPLPSTFGNQTGVVKSPISRPYWIESGDSGRIAFNAQTSNNISVMDPATETLVEYHVPSKNPHWSDCLDADGAPAPDCGVAQIFDLAVDGDMIWFTEWAENNIGVVDTSVPLPVSLDLEPGPVTLAPGGSAHTHFIVASESAGQLPGVRTVAAPAAAQLGAELILDSPAEFDLDPGSPVPIHVSISAPAAALPGSYKVLLGAQTADVAVGQFVTVVVEGEPVPGGETAGGSEDHADDHTHDGEDSTGDHTHDGEDSTGDHDGDLADELSEDLAEDLREGGDPAPPGQ